MRDMYRYAIRTFVIMRVRKHTLITKTPSYLTHRFDVGTSEKQNHSRQSATTSQHTDSADNQRQNPMVSSHINLQFLLPKKRVKLDYRLIQRPKGTENSRQTFNIFLSDHLPLRQCRIYPFTDTDGLETKESCCMEKGPPFSGRA